MIKDSRASHRYASALFGVAMRDEIVDTILTDLIVVERFVAEVPYLRAVLMQPQVSHERKRKVLSEAFGERVTATTLNFLYLLVNKERESFIDETIAEFRRLADIEFGRVKAIVSSAIPLSDAQISAVTDALSKRTGKKVDVEAVVEPDLIAGLRIRLGDEVIDGTVRARLERVRQKLLGTI